MGNEAVATSLSEQLVPVPRTSHVFEVNIALKDAFQINFFIWTYRMVKFGKMELKLTRWQDRAFL